MQKQSPRGVLQEGGWSADVLRTLGGVSVHGCDFNKVAKRLRWCSPVCLLYAWGVSSLDNTSGVLLLNGYNFIYNF